MPGGAACTRGPWRGHLSKWRTQRPDDTRVGTAPLPGQPVVCTLPSLNLSCSRFCSLSSGGVSQMFLKIVLSCVLGILRALLRSVG